MRRTPSADDTQTSYCTGSSHKTPNQRSFTVRPASLFLHWIRHPPSASESRCVDLL